MMKKTLLLFAALTLTFCACNRKPIYDETVSFQERSWNRFRVLTFQPEVEKAGRYYDVVVKISYADGFEYDQIPFHAILTAPDGQRNIVRKNMKVRNAEGGYLGEAYGDVWTTGKVVFEHKQLKDPGVYTFTVQQMTQYYELPGVVAVNCVVKLSEKQ